MKTRDHILAVQTALGIPAELRAPNVGPLTKAAFARLQITALDAEFISPDTLNNDLVISSRNINFRGLQLVKHFESFYPDAYKDSAGVWTIGYGHTGLTHNDGTVFPGRTITYEKALQLLQYDMNQSEEVVNKVVKVPLSDDQFAALVSFHFNTGGLIRSTLLERLNAGDYDEVPTELMRWTKVRGVPLRGLIRRRRSEANLFLGKEDYIVEYV